MVTSLVSNLALDRIVWNRISLLLAIAVGDFTTLCPFSSSFDLSNLALDRIVWYKTETDENTSCPMGDWTSQNWAKREGS